MPRIKAVRPSEAEGRAARLLEQAQRQLGMVPNMMRAMASSPVVLEAHRGLVDALAAGSLSARLREQIALTVAEANGCRYCIAAHTAFGRSIGLSDETILDSRRGASPDSKIEAALRFARAVVEKRGGVDDADVARVRRAGFGDGEIGEIVANVAACVFANYFNGVATTDVDFPDVPEV